MENMTLRILQLEVTTAQGTVLKGLSINKVENHWAAGYLLTLPFSLKG